MKQGKQNPLKNTPESQKIRAAPHRKEATQWQEGAKGLFIRAFFK